MVSRATILNMFFLIKQGLPCSIYHLQKSKIYKRSLRLWNDEQYATYGTLNMIFSVAYYLELHSAILLYTLNSENFSHTMSHTL